MAKCLNCNAELDAGARFCAECGAPVPEQTNQGEYLLRYMDSHGNISSRNISQVLVLNGTMFRCYCHLRNDQRDFQFANVIDITPHDTGTTTKDIKNLFVQRQVDGSELLIPKQESTTPAMSIGNKNVISGDIIQQKNTYNVQGSIINETQSDETKLVKTCSICGIHVANDNGYTCPSCQKFVCSSHFDVKVKLCHSCRDFAKNSAKMEYYEAYTKMLEQGNGLISIENRKALEEIKTQLGLSDEDVAKVESSVTTNSGLSRIEKMELQTAMQQIIQGNSNACIAKLDKMRKDHPDIIDVTAVYQRALKFTNQEALKSITKKFSVESVLSIADLGLQEGNLYVAEKKILETREYPDYQNDPLLACEEAYYRTVVGAVYGKDLMLQKASTILDSISPSEDSYLNEFVDFVRKLIAVISGQDEWDSLNALAPYWKKMAAPVIATKKGATSKSGATTGVDPNSIVQENIGALVATWKSEIEAKQQKQAEAQKAIQELTAKYREEDLQREQERAQYAEKLEKKAKAIAAQSSDSHDDEEEVEEDDDDCLTEEEKEMLAAEEARKAEERARKEAEREARAAEKARREEEREAEKLRKEEERQRKAQEREAEKARKEAEKIRRAEIAASVQPFPVEGEYVFKYRDKMGVVSEKMGNQVFVTDGLRFRCSDPRDPFGGTKTFLLEGVIEIREKDEDETSTDALALFREHEMDPEDYNPFGNTEPDEEDSTESSDTTEVATAQFKDVASAFKEASSRLSESMNKANADLRKSSEEAKAALNAATKEASKKAKGCLGKSAKGCAGIFIILIVIGIIGKIASALFGGSPLDEYFQETFQYEKIVDSRDKQEYRVIQIGDQKWIAQNMNYDAEGSICDSCKLYGRLYTYDAAKNSCPEGFTLPTYTDFTTLISGTAKEGFDAPALLAKKGWGGAGTDKYGFVAIPGGFYSFKSGATKRRGEVAGFWSSSDYGDYAVRMKLGSGAEDESLEGLSKQYGFSVRCISKATSVPDKYEIVIDERDQSILFANTIGNQKWLLYNSTIKTSKSICPEGGNMFHNRGNEIIFRRLVGGCHYEWSAALNACPTGYRLPNAADFEELARSGELKKFFPQYAGFFNTKGERELNMKRADYWSSTAVGNSAKYWYFRESDDNKIYSSKYSKTGAMSVRCIEGALEQNFSYSQFVDDRDDQIYKTVKIGKQVWMAQNLNLSLGGSYCYNNDDANCAIYGRLYEWSDAVNICPEDFHLPEDQEWLELKNFVTNNGDGRIGTDLRSVDNWKGNPGADLFGLGLVPSGYYDRETGEFARLGERAYLWSASEVNSDSATHWAVVGDAEYLTKATVYKKKARAVRCVHD